MNPTDFINFLDNISDWSENNSSTRDEDEI
jgi:hypothetical protein